MIPWYLCWIWICPDKDLHLRVLLIQRISNIQKKLCQCRPASVDRSKPSNLALALVVSSPLHFISCPARG